MHKTNWFQEARFGMFIHWGLYALAARHEKVKYREHLTNKDYQKYFDHFNPDCYNPKEWARVARKAGMRYFVITTKHHDGFCLWDSTYTNYKSSKTPYGKDLLKPMVKAFRDEGLRVGFYYSLIDWHSPDFPVDSIHPMRDNLDYRRKNKKRDVKKYAKYLHSQVRELLTKFGKIDYIFFDFSYPGEDGKGKNDWQSEKLIKMVRTLQPEILVNDRLDLMDVKNGWDIRTPEQFMLREGVKVSGKPVLWETNHTFSGSWGYYRDESTWKSVDQIVMMLIDTVSKGGNFLLNIGPTSRGTFDDRAIARLSGIGQWMKYHSRSIYGCTEAPEKFKTPQDCRLTYNPKTRRIYVHLFAWPFRQIDLSGFADNIEYVQLLHDGSEIKIAQPLVNQADYQRLGSSNTLTLELPVQKPDVTVPVIEVFLKKT